ncbi:hypothetical protein EDC04DRAFT_2763776 [Pisolithus marmoratus]|nr:hypothetical protein EDC04DRAFT_2763776 [Pisolithus marmoratus]
MHNITPAELFPVRYQVPNSNARCLRAFPHPLHIFHPHNTFPGVLNDRRVHSVGSSHPGTKMAQVRPKFQEP